MPCMVPTASSEPAVYNIYTDREDKSREIDDSDFWPMQFKLFTEPPGVTPRGEEPKSEEPSMFRMFTEGTTPKAGLSVHAAPSMFGMFSARPTQTDRRDSEVSLSRRSSDAGVFSMFTTEVNEGVPADPRRAAQFPAKSQKRISDASMFSMIRQGFGEQDNLQRAGTAEFGIDDQDDPSMLGGLSCMSTNANSARDTELSLCNGSDGPNSHRNGLCGGEPDEQAHEVVGAHAFLAESDVGFGSALDPFGASARDRDCCAPRMSTPSIRYLPVQLDGIQVLTIESFDRFRAENSGLAHSGPGLAYRFSKDPDDKDNRYLPWGARVSGMNHYDGWVRCEMVERDCGRICG